MVKVGDTVKATGIGALFVGMIEGSTGMGEVVHVGNPEGVVTDPRVEAENFEHLYLTDGIIYLDSGLNDLMWLADGDYQIMIDEESLQ